MLNRKEKEVVVSELSQLFNASDAAFIVTSSMDAITLQNFRKKLSKASGKMLIAKNTLLRRVADEQDSVKGLVEHFNNQISLIFAPQEGSGSEIAGVIKKESGGKISVVAGLFQGSVISKDKFDFIASIPSKEVLYAQLCGVLLAPASKLALVIKLASEKDTKES